MLRWSGGGATHAGLVRTGNEDSAFVGPTCLLVADGVGGASAGEVASATTAYVISAVALRRRGEDPVAVLDDAVRTARRELARGVEADPARAGMATTLTALVTDGRSIALAHAGDSRGYLLRGGQLVRLTRDDTFVQELLDQGQPVAEEAAHPWRNVVTRTIGAGPGSPAHILPIALLPGDRLLLATDGLTDLIGDDRIAEILGDLDDESAARGLVDAALAAGGRDNVTCVVATLVDGPAVSGDAGRLLGAVQEPGNVIDLGGVRTAS